MSMTQTANDRIPTTPSRDRVSGTALPATSAGLIRLLETTFDRAAVTILAEAGALAFESEAGPRELLCQHHASVADLCERYLSACEIPDEAFAGLVDAIEARGDVACLLGVAVGRRLGSRSLR